MRPSLSPRFPAAPPRTLCAIAAFLLAGSIASLAQDDCAGFLERQITSGGTNGASAVFSADLDGDGYQDVLSASFNDDRIAWYENLISGPGQPVSFAGHTITRAADGATAVFAKNLDGDDDVDVLSASANDNTIAWYENIGNPPQFVRRVITQSAVQASSVFAADVDTDGWQDVLAASFLDGTLAWYENLKSDEHPVVSFTEHVISSDWPGASAISAADIDGDGHTDVVAASYVLDTIAWFESQWGDEIGEDGSVTRVLFFIEHVITTEADGAKSVFPVLVNDDTRMDLLVASSEDNTIAWWENRVGQDPAWVEHVISNEALGVTSVHAAGEGDALILLAASSDADTITLYKRDANDPLVFVEAATVSGVTSVDAVFAADVDSDGVIDALSASSVPGPVSSADKIAWYRNELGQGGGLVEHVIAGTAEGARSVFVADMDGLDAPDIVTAGGAATIGWYRFLPDADPAGWEFHVISTEDQGPSSVFAADLDLDSSGLVDVVAAFDGADKVSWFRNDGGDPPSFTRILIDADVRGASSVAVADLDRDGNGHMDVVSASFDDDRIAWHENTAGDGSAWTTHVISTDADGATAVAVADLNLDGFPDVVSSSFYDDEITWYENRPGEDPAWVEHVISGNANGARYVAVANLDGDTDGYPDIIAAAALTGEITWYQNEEDAEDPSARAFTKKQIAASATLASSVTVHDLDGDTDLDVLVAAAGGLVAWYENDGGSPPSFAAHPVSVTGVQPRAVVAENFDGDGEGRPDLFVGFDFEAAWYEGTGEICGGFDASGDGRIDGVELAWLARAFGRTVAVGAVDWWVPLDYNTDGIVDGADLAILTSVGVWGQTVGAEGTCQYTCQ